MLQHSKHMVLLGSYDLSLSFFLFTWQEELIEAFCGFLNFGKVIPDIKFFRWSKGGFLLFSCSV